MIAVNDDTILGGVLNEFGETAKKTVQQVVNLPEETSKEEKPAEKKYAKKWESDEERTKFLRDLYGSAQPSPEASAGKAEQKKLTELRNKLHKENYYDPTFNPPNPHASGEERPAEKVENEKKMEAFELEKKEKNKPPPLAVVREQNKTEMFRGVAG